MPSSSNVKIRRVFGRTKKPTSIAWATLQQLIKLAESAQIPFGGGAFGIASHLIDILNDASANEAACQSLLATVATFSDTIWEFTQSLSPESLRTAADVAAATARKAIVTFYTHLEEVVSIVQRLLSKGRFERVLLRTAIRGEIDACEVRLRASHKRFQDAVANVILANVCSLSVPTTPTGTDNFKIVGAKSFGHNDVKLLHSKSRREANGSQTFWADTVVGEVQNEKHLVKLYYGKSGGRSAFLRDMDFLGRNARCNLPLISGYCEDATPPFIVLKTASITPYQEHMLSLASRTSKECAVVSAWSMFVDMRDAARFLIDNNDCVDWQMIAATLKDGRVDENGQIVLAPQWVDDKDEVETSYDMLRYYLDQFMTMHAYTMRECRSLDPLWYGFLGNFEAVVDDWPSTIEDPMEEVKRLKEWWPPCSERARPWPHHVDDPPELGDIGIFEPIPGKGVRFKKLGNVLAELGGAEVELEHCAGSHVLSDGILRVEIMPGEDEDDYDSYYEDGCDDPYEDECALDAVVEGQASDGDYDDEYASSDGDPYDDYAEELWTPPSTSHSVDEFGCNWVKRFKQCDDQWSWLARNARRLGKQYAVPPEELVLVTETTWYMCTEAISLDVLHEQPLYLFIHLDEGQTPRCYWTFSPEPLTEEEATVEQLAMTALGCPEPVIDCEDPLCIQLDRTEILA